MNDRANTRIVNATHSLAAAGDCCRLRADPGHRRPRSLLPRRPDIDRSLLPSCFLVLQRRGQHLRRRPQRSDRYSLSSTPT